MLVCLNYNTTILTTLQKVYFSFSLQVTMTPLNYSKSQKASFSYIN